MYGGAVIIRYFLLQGKVLKEEEGFLLLDDFELSASDQPLPDTADARGSASSDTPVPGSPSRTPARGERGEKAGRKRRAHGFRLRARTQGARWF